MSDEAAHAIAWTLRPAQRIPYGRGMLHFLNIDAQLRARDYGKLDDLAVPFAQLCQQQDACGGPEWFRLLRDKLGAVAVDDWNRVSNGSSLIKPLEGSLGPCFEVVQNSSSPIVWVWKAKKSDCDTDLYKDLAVNAERPVCIGTKSTGVGTPTAAVSSVGTAPSTQATTTYPGFPAPPAQTQNGIAKNCTKFYVVVAGDSCWATANANRISLDQFYAWNPAIGECANLWPDYAVCIKA
ncbi:hypothetical protein OPT61_g2163 [Boeremia exigua]|uniref:Uncharacterized protein n=1 Tax=Boeremia exigua TaxID=749465 RepID=A0ACC2IMI3_9PLEO|nr:hypothetical protein OPT61_g2163 [Boeremia exigua]